METNPIECEQLDQAELIRRDAELALALATQDDAPAEVVSTFVRRSRRDPATALLDRPDVQNLLRKIRENHCDTVVLKIKDLILSDINAVVMDEILHVLEKNDVCQALYVQNLDHAIEDIQLKKLIELLKRRPIWCLNIGETYHISQNTWNQFCKALPETSVTHLYVSEHVIDLEMKNEMRENIRKNRKKHDMHCSLRNLRVIERCTNMWWNPINAIRHQLEATVSSSPSASAGAVSAAKSKASSTSFSTSAKSKNKKGKRSSRGHQSRAASSAMTLEDTTEITGEWKFNCFCGEKCSSAENPRYYPLGRMFECTICSIWSHTVCVLGNELTDDDIEELLEVLCSVCRTRQRRNKKAELQALNIVFENGRVVSGGEEAWRPEVVQAHPGLAVESATMNGAVEEVSDQGQDQGQGQGQDQGQDQGQGQGQDQGQGQGQDQDQDSADEPPEKRKREEQV